VDQPYLRMIDIAKSFPGVQALKGVNLDAFAGQALGLVGANGAGKSTLMNVLGGVVRADVGHIEILGKTVEINGPLGAALLGIAFIHQELALMPTLSVVENVFISSFTTKGGLIDFRVAEERCAEALARLGCDVNPRTKVRDLAAGERQLVEIARALLVNARIIIFDEPTSSLTQKEQKHLFAVIESLKKEGVAIIYITHFLDEIFDICERVEVLRDGQTVGGGFCEELTRDGLIRLMIGDTISHYFRERKAQIGEPVLEVEGLRREGILEDINFTLHKGEILGLWGLMGSGRTELARCLTGLDPISSGSIKVRTNGALEEISPQDARRWLGLITESRRDDGLLLPMSVTENLSLANLRALLSRIWPFVDSGRERSLGQQFVDVLHIKTPRLEQPVELLSGGNQQKVVLGRWLQRNPAIYIMDEPTRGLDVGAKAEIHKIIADLADESKAILLISSEIEEMMGLSDRYLVLNRGRIVAQYPAGAGKEELMAAAAGVRTHD